MPQRIDIQQNTVRPSGMCLSVPSSLELQNHIYIPLLPRAYYILLRRHHARLCKPRGGAGRAKRWHECMQIDVRIYVRGGEQLVKHGLLSDRTSQSKVCSPMSKPFRTTYLALQCVKRRHRLLHPTGPPRQDSRSLPRPHDTAASAAHLRWRCWL